MAHVRFLPPLTKVTGSKTMNIDAKTVRELCIRLIDTINLERSLLLDEKDNLSRNIVLLVNRRNAHTLKGADTNIANDTEILVMQYFVGG